jgi:hypothetical protein
MIRPQLKELPALRNHGTSTTAVIEALLRRDEGDVDYDGGRRRATVVRGSCCTRLIRIKKPKQSIHYDS